VNSSPGDRILSPRIPNHGSTLHRYGQGRTDRQQCQSRQQQDPPPNNRTRRRFLPNLQTASLQSYVLGESVRMRITTSALRTIEKNGGLDAWLLGTSNVKLSPEARKLKRRIVKKAASAA
jgi:large subunit ribosomal protein L28